jgi:hypothetical protein
MQIKLRAAPRTGFGAIHALCRVSDDIWAKHQTRATLLSSQKYGQHSNAVIPEKAGIQ